LIARTWRGRVRRRDAASYTDYLRATGVAFYRKQPGNEGVLVMRRDSDAVSEFLFVSLWRSADDIPVPDAEDPEVARYYPEDTEFLLELDPRAPHFDVVIDER
jgi:heme-degrading monooxygenase HmoA